MSNNWVDKLSPSVRAEAERLCKEILGNLECHDAPLSGLALKGARVASMLGHEITRKLLELEAKGYPIPLPTEEWNLAVVAGRKFIYTDPKTHEKSDRVYADSIDALESRKRTAEQLLAKSTTWMEQNAQTTAIQTLSGQLAARRTIIHVLTRHILHALKFAEVASDVFERASRRATELVAKHVSQGAEHLSSLYRNMESENPEDWANAVHSCRRLLKDVADAVFPPREPITVGGEQIALGNDQYLNRLVTFVSEHSTSERFSEIVGSDLKFIGDRLEAIHSAASKGTHARVTREEADRYIIHTYLMVADILSLKG